VRLDHMDAVIFWPEMHNPLSVSTSVDVGEGQKVVVGVNKFKPLNDPPIDVRRIERVDPSELPGLLAGYDFVINE